MKHACKISGSISHTRRGHWTQKEFVWGFYACINNNYEYEIFLVSHGIIIVSRIFEYF